MDEELVVEKTAWWSTRKTNYRFILLMVPMENVFEAR